MKDFGPIGRAKLELRPLTVFIGPSNTGKSYLATLIYALHRRFDDRKPEEFMYQVSRWRRKVRPDIDLSIVQPLIDLLKTLIDRHGDDYALPGKQESLPETLIPEEPLLRELLQDLYMDADSEGLGDEISRCFGQHLSALPYRSGKEEDAFAQIYWYSPSDVSGRYAQSIILNSRGIAFSSNVRNTLRILGPVDSVWLMHLVRRLEAGATSHNSPASDLGLAIKESIAVLAGYLDRSVYADFNSTAYYLPVNRTGMMHALIPFMRAMLQTGFRSWFVFMEQAPVNRRGG